jgi:hypothetical protein
MARKQLSKGDKEKRDRVLTTIDRVPTVPVYDGEFSLSGRRVLVQEGSLLPLSRSVVEQDNLRRELSDKLVHDRAHYPIYMYGLTRKEGTSEPYCEIPRVKLCDQIFSDIASYLPYQVLEARELDTALRITPVLFSPNAIRIWDELGWAEKEFLVDKNANPGFAIPLALQAAMGKYIADPVRYSDGKNQVIDAWKENPAERAKYIKDLKNLKFRLMDHFEPSLLANIVDEIMDYDPKKK